MAMEELVGGAVEMIDIVLPNTDKSCNLPWRFRINASRGCWLRPIGQLFEARKRCESPRGSLRSSIEKGREPQLRWGGPDSPSRFQRHTPDSDFLTVRSARMQQTFSELTALTTISGDWLMQNEIQREISG
jgi:hypothetical protein